MNILIFANGIHACNQLLQQALSRGHYVTWFTAIDTQSNYLSHENLYTISGDTLNYALVEEAMQGQEIVIDAMYLELKDNNAFYITSATNILKAMMANHVTRFILISRYGVNNNVKQAPLLYQLWFRFINWFKMAELSGLMMLENFVRDSSLQWTIVKPVILIKSRNKIVDPFAIYKPGAPIRKSMVSADALAGFLLTIAVKGSFIQEIVTISNK